MANNTLYTNNGVYGTNTVGNVGSLMQGQTGVVMLFTLKNLAGTAIDISSYVVTGKLTQKSSGTTAALTGTVAVTANAASGEFSWTTSAADVGEEGDYILWFSLTRGSNPDFVTLPLTFAVIDDPDATGTFSANLVGVTVAERAWLTAALATGNALADYQPLDAGLTDIAALAVTNSNFIVGDGTNWVAETGATARTSLGLAIGTNVQAYDAQLADIAGLAVTDGNFIVGDGANWVAESGATARASMDALPIDAGIVAVSGARDLTGTDNGKILECDGTFSLTCPDSLDAGFQVAVANVGSGTITIAAATTLVSKASAVTLDTQYAMATVYHRGSNVWLLAGDIA